MMSASTLLSLSEAAGIVLMGVGSAFYGKRAARASESAERLSAPTGNGWTRGLGERLDRQDSVLLRIESKLDGHLRDHAFPHLPHDKD